LKTAKFATTTPPTEKAAGIEKLEAIQTPRRAPSGKKP
jgi:hypothetical protein